MTIEISVLISAVSVAFAIYFGIKGAQRANVKDIEERTAQNTTINIKLDSISNAVNDIKYDISETKKKVEEIDRRLIIAEQSTKSAHRRLDNMERGERSHHED